MVEKIEVPVANPALCMVIGLFNWIANVYCYFVVRCWCSYRIVEGQISGSIIDCYKKQICICLNSRRTNKGSNYRIIFYVGTPYGFPRGGIWKGEVPISSTAPLRITGTDQSDIYRATLSDALECAVETAVSYGRDRKSVV